MMSISPADYLAPVQSSQSRRSGHDQMYQVSYASRCPDRCLQILFLPGNCTYMWNALPASVIQSGTLSSLKAGISDYYGH